MQTCFVHEENNFDFIRILLALLVIFSHSYPLATGSEALEPFLRLSRGQVTGGHIAVDLFFIISGFLITASFERSRTIWSFLKKRIARIYPAFIVVSLLSVLIVLPASGGHLSASTPCARVAGFITQTARLKEFSYVAAFPANPLPGTLNGATWSIPYEFWCYIGVILLGVTGVLGSRRALLGLFVASIVVSVIFASLNLKPGGKILGRIFGYPPFWARLLSMYLAGVVSYRFRHQLSLKASLTLLSCAGLALATVLPHGWTLLFPIAGTYLLLVLAFHPAIHAHNWSRFGDFSYGTYLYAFPVQQLIMMCIGHTIAPWKLFLMAAPVTLVCAALSWHLVEKRFLRSSHRTPRFAEPMAAART